MLTVLGRSQRRTRALLAVGKGLTILFVCGCGFKPVYEVPRYGVQKLQEKIETAIVEENLEKRAQDASEKQGHHQPSESRRCEILSAVLQAVGSTSESRWQCSCYESTKAESDRGLGIPYSLFPVHRLPD